VRKILLFVAFALLTALFVVSFPPTAKSDNVRFGPYKFALDEKFEFPSAPKSMSVFEVQESYVKEEWAAEIARKFGFVDKEGNPLKPVIDYYYQMPHFNPPTQREEKMARSTEQVDDEKPGDQGYELPKQPDPQWPPKGAKAKIKIFTFIKENEFLKINENNGAIFYSNNDFMNFALGKEGLQLSDDNAWEIASEFLKSVDLPEVEWDPSDRYPSFSDVMVYQAEHESGKVLNSYVCMKEVTFARELNDYPVIGGGGAIRIAIGVGYPEEAENYGVASFSRLMRTITNPEIAQMIYTPGEAYNMLQKGEGIVNDTLRFYAEGTIVINDAYLAYYAPTGYEDVDYLTPVWVFTGYDSKNPSNEMQFYINAKKEETPPDETFVEITTDKEYYTGNDSQQVGIEIYCAEAEDIVLYIGLYAPDGYFYSFPFWTPNFFPINGSLPAGFHLGPIDFLEFDPVTEGPYDSSGHYVYFAFMLDQATMQLICPLSVAEFDIE